MNAIIIIASIGLIATIQAPPRTIISERDGIGIGIVLLLLATIISAATTGMILAYRIGAQSATIEKRFQDIERTQREILARLERMDKNPPA